jgi:hypothetical protein
VGQQGIDRVIKVCCSLNKSYYTESDILEIRHLIGKFDLFQPIFSESDDHKLWVSKNHLLKHAEFYVNILKSFDF